MVTFLKELLRCRCAMSIWCRSHRVRSKWGCQDCNKRPTSGCINGYVMLFLTCSIAYLYVTVILFNCPCILTFNLMHQPTIHIFTSHSQISSKNSAPTQTKTRYTKYCDTGQIRVLYVNKTEANGPTAIQSLGSKV